MATWAVYGRDRATVESGCRGLVVCDGGCSVLKLPIGLRRLMAQVVDLIQRSAATWRCSALIALIW